MLMTPEQFKAEMEELAKNGDLEDRHGLADDLMCSVLRDLGYGAGVDRFEWLEKWYA